MVSEDQLKIWATPPSAVKYITTKDRIEKVLINKFGGKIKVYLQGSYKNSTNIRSESDVDIVVEYTPAYYPGFFGMSQEQIAHYHTITTKHDYNFSQFKSDVHDVLLEEFSSEKVVLWHPKCIRVLKNENRVNADVVVCFTHQRYTDPYTVDAVGIHFFTDSEKVVNFPVQHHKNGEDKNIGTNGKFKDAVRIYKNIMYRLVDLGELEKDEIPSHLIESLVWNVPNSHFVGTNMVIAKAITGKIWNDMKLENDPYNKYKYIHALKWLFKGETVNTPAKAQKFMQKVWNFAGF